MRLGILGSTRGTHLTAIAAAIAERLLQAEIVIVLSNKIDAGILKRAELLALSHCFIPSDGLSREQYDECISQQLKAHRVDLIVLIGYMRILSAAFVTEWANKIINVHPSLLPAFAGKMDLAVHEAVIEAKVMETGCTVHYVTTEVDAGPIVLQERCAVMQTDTPLQLKDRVQALEGIALIKAIQSIDRERRAQF